jgi:tellurite resistance protein TerC
VKAVRRIVISVVGGVVLLAGVAMILLPGPAFIVIPAGLAILAMEFPWAKRWLNKAREAFQRFTKRKEKPL